MAQNTFSEKMKSASFLAGLSGGLTEGLMDVSHQENAGLHEAQIEQLQLYGLAFSASVKEATFEPDHEAKTIKYLVTVDPKLMENDIGKRIALLKRAVAAICRGWSATVRMRQEGTTTDED